MTSSPRGAFLFLDLDDMFCMNKTWGYEAGDELLEQIGRELRALAKGKIVVRLGGDEFVVLLPDGSLEDAHDLAVTIARRIAEIGARWPVEGGSPGVGATVIARLWGNDPQTDIRLADWGQALLKNLRMGQRNQGHDGDRVLNVATVGELALAIPPATQ